MTYLNVLGVFEQMVLACFFFPLNNGRSPLFSPRSMWRRRCWSFADGFLVGFGEGLLTFQLAPNKVSLNSFYCSVKYKKILLIILRKHLNILLTWIFFLYFVVHFINCRLLTKSWFVSSATNSDDLPATFQGFGKSLEFRLKLNVVGRKVGIVGQNITNFLF